MWRTEYVPRQLKLRKQNRNSAKGRTTLPHKCSWTGSSPCNLHMDIYYKGWIPPSAEDGVTTSHIDVLWIHLTLDILTGVIWESKEVVVWIPLRAKNIEHIFKCLYIFFRELFSSLSHFLIGFLKYSSLYILEINPLMCTCLKIYSCSKDQFFMLVTIYFAVQTVLKFMSIHGTNSCAIWGHVQTGLAYACIREHYVCF